MPETKSIKFGYTNYRGERAVRTATPRNWLFMGTEHHPEPQWIMVAWCEDRYAIRHFALKDCDFTHTAPEVYPNALTRFQQEYEAVFVPGSPPSPQSRRQERTEDDLDRD